jgi:hypothetical protein
MYDGAKLWNSIPKEIRESKSLSSFRNKIAAYIYEYYTVISIVNNVPVNSVPTFSLDIDMLLF